MAIKQFPVSWVGVYRASSNSYYGGVTPILAGGSSGYNSYVGIPSAVKDAIKTSKTPAQLKFKMNVTNSGEFDFGGHRETYNKAGGSMPWYSYLGLHPIYSTGWRTTDLTSAFMSSYLNGNYHGIVLYGSSDLAQADGLSGDSSQAVFVVEGSWNTPPTTPPSVSSPTSSTVADTSVLLDWSASSDSEQASSQLSYELEYYNGSSWETANTITTSAGVTQYNYTLTGKPETSSAQFRIRAFDGSLRSGWRYSPKFTVSHNKPPAKPTNLTPVGGKVINRTSLLRVTWRFNDSGNQAGYRLAWRTISESGAKGTWVYYPSSTGWVNSISEYHDFPASTFPLGEIEWTVTTKDQQGEVSPYASYERFYAGEASDAPIWIEPAGGAVLNSSEVIAHWSSIDQEEYELQLREAGLVIWSEQEIASNKSTLVGYGLENNKSYALRVRVVNEDSGLWSGWSEVTFSTQFVAPSKPVLTVETDDQNGNSLDNILASWDTDVSMVPPLTSQDWSGALKDNATQVTDSSISVDNTAGIEILEMWCSIPVVTGETYTVGVTVTGDTSSAFPRIYKTAIGENNGPKMIGDKYSTPITFTVDDSFEGFVSMRMAVIVGGVVTFSDPMMNDGTTLKPYVVGSETKTDYVQVYRREYNAHTEQPWLMIGDTRAPDSSMVDYSPASEQAYQYKVRAWGNNDTFTDSNVSEGEIKLTHSFLQRAVSLSDLLVINAEEREESFDLGGEMMLFANRSKPVFEHGINEMRDIPIAFSLDSVSELRSTIEFVKRRETFLFRDNVGRKMYCVIRQPKVTDKIVNGFTMSLTLSEVDYIEVT